MRPATDVADFLAGFVAAEGTFTHSGGRFAFAVALGAADGSMCEAMQTFFGVGRVRRYTRRKPHYDDETVFVVRGLRDLVEVVVPFADAHLAACHKRQQFEQWAEALLLHWEVRARRVRRCTEVGCDEPRRARGLCRRHYYAVYRR